MNKNLNGQKAIKGFMYKPEIEKILKLLQKAYPKAFPENIYAILKKGIDLDICKDDKITINRTKLRKFLKIYTYGRRYRELHIIGAKRYDLDGNIVGEVTEDDCKSIAKNFKLRNKRRKFLQKQY